jgi:hypothetical protein
MWRCQKCNSENPASASFCQTCGEKKAALGSAQAARTAWKSASESLPNPGVSVGSMPIRRIENYLKENATAGLLNTLGTIMIVFGVIATIIAFFYAAGGGGGSFHFLFGLLGAIVALPFDMIPGLLLKAVARIWQNSDDTVSLLRYQIDTQNDKEATVMIK